MRASEMTMPVGDGQRAAGEPGAGAARDERDRRARAHARTTACTSSVVSGRHDERRARPGGP